MSKVEFDCGKWLQEAEEFALPNWSALPSIPLYMDQVMMFTGEALSLFERDEKQSLLTNSMINNYVKSGVVDHPVHKKYSKEHLSKLMMVGLLKQVLSIQDIAVLFSGNEDAEQLYKDFAAAQSGALHETAAGVHPESDAAALRAAALKLAAEATGATSGCPAHFNGAVRRKKSQEIIKFVTNKSLHGT